MKPSFRRPIRPGSMSVARFARIAEHLGACELVHGEVMTLSPGGLSHSEIVGRVTTVLGAWNLKARRGRVLSGEVGIVTDAKAATVRGADVSFISYKRLPRGRLPRGFLKIAPELVIEVISLKQGWPQAIEKSAEYLRCGVDRVWIIDPGARALYVVRGDEAPQRLEESDWLQDAAILPRFRCRVRQLLDE